MKYAWLLIIGVILLIIGLCLSYAWQVKEGMADTGSIVLAGIGNSSDVYIADTGLANIVKWNAISGSVKQISGSIGQIVGVNASNEVMYGSLVGKVSPNSGSGKTVSAGLIGGKEVYAVSGSYTAAAAATTCSALGATLATYRQVVDAQATGAGWCTWGWISDISGNSNQIAFPVQTGMSCEKDAPGVLVRIQRATGSYAATCYGAKPAQGQSNALAFNSSQWNQNGYIWTKIPGAATQVSFDYPFLAALDTTGKLQVLESVNAISPVFKAFPSAQTFKWVATNAGSAYAIGTDNNVYYTNDIRDPKWTNISGQLNGKTLVKVAFDSYDVIILGSDNSIYYGEDGPSPVWKQLSLTAKHISIKNHMMYFIGTDGNLYFSPAPYEISIKVSSGITYVDVMYPMGTNVITERPAIVKPCPTVFRPGSGSDAGSGSTLSSWLFGETCLDPCPPGYTQNTGSGICVGIPVPRTTRVPTEIPLTTYKCPTGYDLYLAATTTTCNIVDSTIDLSGVVAPLSEVYQVPGSYKQAQGKNTCHMYGAVHATKQQLTDAYTAGASWCVGGWVSDDLKNVYNPDAKGICGFSGPSLNTTVNNSGRAPVHCYGVKPSITIAPSLMPFNKTLLSLVSQWNQVPQCGFGYSLKYKSMACISSCPSTSMPIDEECVYRGINKTSQLPTNINFTCPVGYDLPTIIACGTANQTAAVPCTKAQTCYQSCPANYTRSATTCIGAITPKTNVGAVKHEVFAVEGSCAEYGASTATVSQLVTAGSAGSSVCQWGAVTGNTNAYAINCPTVQGTQTGFLKYNSTVAKAVTYCFGVKPPPVAGTAASPKGVLEFAPGTWYMTTQCMNGSAMSYEGPYTNISIGGSCPKDGCGSYTSASSAQAACTTDNYCSGITGSNTDWKKQFGTTQSYASGKISYIKRTTTAGCFSSCGTSQDIGNESYKPLLLQFTGGTQISTYSSLIAAEAACSSTNSGCYYITQTSPTTWVTYTSGTQTTTPSTLPTYIRNMPQCQLPDIDERKTVDSTITPPCPSGYTEYSTLCYKNCADGYIEETETTCAKTSVKRTVDKVQLTTTDPTDTLCKPTEDVDVVNKVCVSKCAPGEIKTPTTCTPANMTPSGKPIESNCNSNEILVNNVCISKCPEGTYPDGDLCVEQKRAVPYPKNLTPPCVSAGLGSYKKWFCDSDDSVTVLLRDPSSTTTYVDDNDQVCVADDPTTGMYFCQSGKDAKEETGYVEDIRSNYYNTCDNLTKNLIDLSGSMATIEIIKAGLTTGTATLTETQTTLNNMYTKMNCTTATGNILIMCNQIKTAAAGINTNSMNIGKSLTLLSNQLQDILNSQKSLSKSIGTLKCSETSLR
jgi:hypothetical protein